MPLLLRRFEYARYEGGEVIRFENSDLFGLGPLVSYLREHPRGERPRIAFFGNSVIWGYSLKAEWAIPARLQEVESDTRVFNLAVNGFETGSGYLIAKAMIDAVDRLYVQRYGTQAHPMLASLVPVDPDDVRAFNLRPPDGVERRLETAVGAWQLYAASYRLQAAVFGTSTRQYLYLHKGDIVRRLLSPIYVMPPVVPSESGDGVVEVTAPRPPSDPTAERRAVLQRHQPLLWKFGQLAASHRKRVVFLQIGNPHPALSDEELADFNAIFAPFGEIVRLSIPASLKFDMQHLTVRGSRRAAEALARHERESAVEAR